MNITQDIARILFSYDKDTGDVLWRDRNRCLFKSDKEAKRWNTRYAGVKSGSLQYTDRGQEYINIKIFGKKHLCHRIIWLYVYGHNPEQIDHIDGNGLNNRLSNLRNVDHSGNQKNRKLNSTNTSGYSGISLVDGKWKVRFNSRCKSINVGRFLSLDDAITARDVAYKDHGFHANHGNR